MCALVLGEVCGNVNVPKHDWNVVFPDVPKPTVKEIPVEVFTIFVNKLNINEIIFSWTFPHSKSFIYPTLI